jgi:hypothetical protein
MNTLSLNAHVDTSIKTYIHHNFCGAWTGRVFLGIGHPDLKTSLRFTLSQLFTSTAEVRCTSENWKHKLYYFFALRMLQRT